MKWRSLLTNLLLIIPVVALGYTYWPVIFTEYNYRTQGELRDWQPVDSTFSIVIPKLGINELVIADVDPFNYSDYMKALEQGVAQASGSYTPDIGKTTYLFAHSSDNPFSITRYNTSFYLLSRLAPGDKIYLYYQGQEYVYQMDSNQVVSPNQVEYLTKLNEHQLILQTCTPIGTALNRLLVFASPVEI